MKWNVALSLTAGLLMAAASAAGIFIPAVYGRETASWSAQGAGQDVVNLFVIAPALLVSLFYVSKDSLPASLVWLGLLIYMIYSYVLYAFFVHFNTWFLVYVAVLSTSFWALVGAVSSVNLDRLSRVVNRDRRYTAQALYLMASGLLFAALWLSDIVPALASGTTPPAIVEVGLPVNPIHVLDLAFILPAMIVTSILLWRRNIIGLLFAVPLMTVAAAMGAAIIGMSLVLNARGLGDGTGIIAVFVVLIAIALDLTYTFLTRMSGA